MSTIVPENSSRARARWFPILAGLVPAIVLTNSLFQFFSWLIVYSSVLLLSHSILFSIRSFVPPSQREAYTFLATSVVTALVWILLDALLPAISTSLGIFLPLMAVQCLMIDTHHLFRGDAVFKDVLRPLYRGTLQSALVLLALALLRDVLGNGTLRFWIDGGEWQALRIPGLEAEPLRMLAETSVAFIILGSLMALIPYSEKES